MKQRNCIKIFLAVLFGCVTLACSDNDSTDSETFKQPTLTNVTNSGCKGTPYNKVRSNSKQNADKAESIILKALPDGKLLIEHHNTVLSCDALIKQDMTTEDRTIILTEAATNDTNCTCDYDLKFTLDNLSNTTYKVIIQRQGIDRTGKPTYDPEKYAEFSLTFAPGLSKTISLN